GRLRQHPGRERHGGDRDLGGARSRLASSFKITGALPVIGPGADKLEVVSGTPMFGWGDDTSEDHYELRVFDAFGNKVWEDLAVPRGAGANVSVTYGGPALQPGMIYQFRATSIKKGGTAISTTEDLRGVFAYK